MTQSSDIVITVEKREGTGAREAARLRRAGRIPAVVYGGEKPPYAITVDDTSLRDLLKTTSGANTIFLLKLAGSKDERQAMIKELQTDPISGKFLHIDFIRVVKGHKLTIDVPVILTGDSVGVRHGGRIDFVTREIAVEVLPKDMFDRFTLDISDLEVGDNFTVEDLKPQLPPSAVLLDEDNRVIVLVEAARGPSEEEIEAEEKEAAERLISESAEPELIKRGRGDEGDE
jgi:large subunit ribosomal protein L25